MFYSRKSPRIAGYDYSSYNYYFITICTYEKRCIFGLPEQLNKIGNIVKECIQKIEKIFPGACVDNYIVMPNHIHIILVNGGNEDINMIIGQLKAAATKQIRMIYPEMRVWQRSYHDHIIRNQQEYEKIWQYVTYNNQKWQEDCFYQSIREGQ